jgi:hypothetical protein
VVDAPVVFAVVDRVVRAALEPTPGPGLTKRPKLLDRLDVSPGAIPARLERVPSRNDAHGTSMMHSVMSCIATGRTQASPVTSASQYVWHRSSDELRLHWNARLQFASQNACSCSPSSTMGSESTQATATSTNAPSHRLTSPDAPRTFHRIARNFPSAKRLGVPFAVARAGSRPPAIPPRLRRRRTSARRLSPCASSASSRSRPRRASRWTSGYRADLRRGPSDRPRRCLRRP